MDAEITDTQIDKIAGLSAPSRPKRFLKLHYSEFGWALLLFDFGLIVSLSVLGGLFYHKVVFDTLGDLEAFLGAGFVVGGLFVSCQKALGLYEPVSLTDRSRSVTRVVAVWVVVFTFFAAAAFLLKITTSFSRGTMVLWFASGLVAVTSVREIAARLFVQGLETGSLQARRVLAICDRDELEDAELGRVLRRCGYQVGAFFSASPVGTDAWSTVLDEIREEVRSHDVAEVLICVSWHDTTRVEELVSALRVVPLPVRLIPDRKLRPFLSETLLRGGSALGVEVQRAPLTRVERAVKRSFDLCCASAGLLMLLPLMIVVAVAIKLDSRGPVLFRQHRTGFNGRAFSIYKFRTMTTMENGSQVRQATRNDSRVTRMGRFLRSSSIDELPQLINVIAGHMSLVGPRPHALAHDDYYSRLISDYALRQHVKPGITGWAQVNGLRGETADVEVMRRRVEYDLWYVSNWSFLLDLKVIIRTCIQVLNSSDAY